MKTPMFKVNFPEVFTPTEYPKGCGKFTYKITMLFNDKTDLTGLKTEIEQTAKDFFGSKMPKEWRNPLKIDEDTGLWCLKANCGVKYAPLVIDRDLNPILDRKEIYSGAICCAEIKFFGYDQGGNKGVTCKFKLIQKVKDGNPMVAVDTSAYAAPDEDFSWE